jgi:lysophospholipase L1-like esterase
MAVLASLSLLMFLPNFEDDREKTYIKFSDDFMLRYPSHKSFWGTSRHRKEADSKEIKKNVDKTTGENFDNMVDQLIEKPDTAFNKQDTTLKGNQNDVRELPEIDFSGVQSIDFPNDDRSLFTALFNKLNSAGNQKMHVMHFGDSQLEGDRITKTIRENLQKIFGGNGPGFIPAKPYYHQNTVNIKHSDNWSRHTSFFRKTAKHNRVGAFLSYSRFTPHVVDSLIDTTSIKTGWIQLGKSKYAHAHAREYSQVNIHYTSCRLPVSIKVYNNDELITNDSLRTDGNYHMFPIRLGGTPENLKIEFSGYDSPDILGLTLDGNVGIVMDNIAMRGSSGSEISSSNFTEFNAMMDNLNTEFVILQFGGNSVPHLTSDDNARRVASNIKYRINRIKQARPNATVLVIGPADMSIEIEEQRQTYPYLPVFINALKEASLEAGAAYWNTYEAMGGLNSMIVWKEQYGWAGDDYIHFSPKGTSKIAQMFLAALLKEYSHYKSSNP